MNGPGISTSDYGDRLLLAGPHTRRRELWLVLRAVRMSRVSEHAAVATAVALSTICQVIFTNTLAGVTAMTVYPMLALAVMQPSERSSGNGP